MINIGMTRKYKTENFMAMFYMMIMSVNAVLANKYINSPLGIFSAASIISPIWFMLGDVIAEVYGYKTSRSFFWSVTICQIIFSIICYFIIKLPSPAFWHGQDSYELVTGHLLKIAIFSFFGSLVGWRINIYFLMKWKILMKGRYFWLRSMGSSIVGETAFSIFSIIPILIGTMSFNQMMSVVSMSCILKMVGLFLLSPIGSFCVFLLNFIDENKKDVLIKVKNPLSI